MSSTGPDRSTRLAERLHAEGKLSPHQFEAVAHNVRTNQIREEEAIIECGAMTEAELLKYVATAHRTRFVSTEKLSRAEIEPATLQLIPRVVAEKHLVFPVLWEPNTGSISLVTPDVGDALVAKTVQGTNASIRDVKLYAARPKAVRAAIAKHYGGDIYAFAHLDRKGIEQFQSIMNVFERNVLSEESLATSIASSERRHERVFSDRDLEQAGRRTIARTPTGQGTQQANTVQSENYVETLTVLVSLLENSRGELRGHSPLVARLMKKMAERIGLAPAESHSLQVASLLHDIGKTGVYHLTALNVAEYEGHRTAAQKSVLTPTRMFESVHLSMSTESAIRSMYERFDGQGFPDGTSGKEIALGARLLAIADTYADLTQNTRNPFRKKLSPSEACDVLARYKAKVFDPNLVDVFRSSVLGDDLRAKLLSDRPVILLIDADPEESTVLELRLLEHGFEVLTARSPESAGPLLSQGTVELVVSETDFGSGKSTGFDLLSRAKSTGNNGAPTLPWIFLTREAGREMVSTAFELGAADYVIKPVPNDVLVAKIRRIMDSRTSRGARGVSGSLSEMALPDIVQILAQGRKTGKLRIRSKNETGEIHFDAGQVINAMWMSFRGEEAFYQLCTLAEGEFAVDPNFKPGSRVIQATVESLLLEGMRRLDEGGA